MITKKWASSLLILSVLLAVTGCRQANPAPRPGPTTSGYNKPGQERTPPGEENPSAKEAPQRPANPDQQKNTRAPQQEQRAQTAGNRSQQADHIAQVLTGIPGIERAYVLLVGKMALVGIDLKSDISGSKIDSIKFSAKEAAEQTGRGYKAVVSSDVDTVTRIREMANGVRSGRPVSSFTDEIADILSRLLPEA